jgi:hypothetical protein
MTVLLMVMAVLGWVAAGIALAGETKYATGTSSAAVTFGPQTGQQVVKSLYATSDKEDGAAKFYVWNQVATKSPATAPTNGQVLLTLNNIGLVLTTNDVVVYSHSTGTAVYRTISSSSTGTVTLSSGLTEAGTTDDRIYELTQGGQIVVGYDGATVGTADGLPTAGDVFATPGGSPLYVLLDATSNAVLQVTVE